MNIFVLDEDPLKAAEMQCDKHVIKMSLETAQMLCTAVNELGGQGKYESAYLNHPCTAWARASRKNFEWLVKHGIGLCSQYLYRYGKRHACHDVIIDCAAQAESLDFPCHDMTPHPLCMPDEFKGDDVVSSYRRFYLSTKSCFALWTRPSKAPDWWRAA